MIAIWRGSVWASRSRTCRIRRSRSSSGRGGGPGAAALAHSRLTCESSPTLTRARLADARPRATRPASRSAPRPRSRAPSLTIESATIESAIVTPAAIETFGPMTERSMHGRGVDVDRRDDRRSPPVAGGRAWPLASRKRLVLSSASTVPQSAQTGVGPTRKRAPDVDHGLQRVGQVELAADLLVALDDLVDRAHQRARVAHVVDADDGQVADRLLRLLDQPLDVAVGPTAAMPKRRGSSTSWTNRTPSSSPRPSWLRSASKIVSAKMIRVGRSSMSPTSEIAWAWPRSSRCSTKRLGYGQCSAAQRSICSPRWPVMKIDLVDRRRRRAGRRCGRGSACRPRCSERLGADVGVRPQAACRARPAG